MLHSDCATQQRRWKLRQRQSVCRAWWVAAVALCDRGPGPARGRHRDNFSEDVKDEWELSKGCVHLYTCVFIQRMCDVCVFICVYVYICMCRLLCDHVYIDLMCMYVWALRQHSRYKPGGQLSPTLYRTLPRAWGCSG